MTPFSAAEELERETSKAHIYKDVRSLRVHALPRCVWKVIAGIGGEYGWYHAEWLWVLRGYLDNLFGGVGMRPRTRRPYAFDLRHGDEVGFWRVVGVVPGRYLRLMAEMKLPGTATLTFEIKNIGDGTSELWQIARFLPSGVLGRLYWCSILLIHQYVFGGMIKKIAQIAEGLDCAHCPEPCPKPLQNP